MTVGRWLGTTKLSRNRLRGHVPQRDLTNNVMDQNETSGQSSGRQTRRSTVAQDYLRHVDISTSIRSGNKRLRHIRWTPMDFTGYRKIASTCPISMSMLLQPLFRLRRTHSMTQMRAFLALLRREWSRLFSRRHGVASHRFLKSGSRKNENQAHWITTSVL
jgi:hypothetical protein